MNNEQVTIQLVNLIVNNGDHLVARKDYLYEKLSEKMARSCKGCSGRFEFIKSIKLDINYPSGIVFDDMNRVLVVSDWTNKRIGFFEYCCSDQTDGFNIVHLGGFSVLEIPAQILIENNGILNESGHTENGLIVCSNRILKYNLTDIIRKLKRKESLDNVQPTSIIDLTQASDDDTYFGSANSGALVERDGKKQLLLCLSFGTLFGDMSNGTKDSTYTEELCVGGFTRDACSIGDGKIAVSGGSDESSTLKVFQYQNGKWNEEYSLDLPDVQYPQRLLYDEINSILYISDFGKHNIHSFDLILKKKVSVFQLEKNYSMTFIRNEDNFILVVGDIQGGLHFFK